MGHQRIHTYATQHQETAEHRHCYFAGVMAVEFIWVLGLSEERTSVKKIYQQPLRIMSKSKRPISETERENHIELIKNPTNVFKCGHDDCTKLESMPPDEFKNHLMEVHKVDPNQRMHRQMIAHIDGSYWFSSTYEWTLLSGLKFSQYIRMARSKDDPMFFN